MLSRTPAFDIKKGFVIQFEGFLFKKVKLKTTLDDIFMSVLNFDCLVPHEILTREVCRNVKKEQNQKRDLSRLQTKQQQKLTTLLASE